MAETPYHAWTRTIDPLTRQPKLLGGVWVPGSPAAEVVAWVLSTPRGSFLPDPTLGVDYASVSVASPDGPARLSAAITAALAFAVDDGTIADLRVESASRGAYIEAEVAFTDPHDLTRQRQRRRVRV